MVSIGVWVALGIFIYALIVSAVMLLWALNRSDPPPDAEKPTDWCSCCASASSASGCNYPSFRRMLRGACPNAMLSCEYLVLCQCCREDSTLPTNRPGLLQSLPSNPTCRSLNCVCCDIALTQAPPPTLSRGGTSINRGHVY